MIWIVLPVEREVVVVSARGTTRHSSGQRLPPYPELPALAPLVDDFFRQIATR